MQEKLFFRSSSGAKLSAILSNPTGSKDSPIVVFAHGLASSKYNRTNPRFEKILNEKGISTFFFDFYGHGESEGLFENITAGEAVDDVLSAIRFLKERGHRRIGLVGSSFGGLASSIAASKTQDLVFLAQRCPVSDFEEIELKRLGKEGIRKWKKNGYREHVSFEGVKRRLNYSFFEDAGKHKAYEAAKKIRIPTLIVHGDADGVVPLEQSKKLSSLIKNCRLEIIKGSDHFFSKQEHFEKMLEIISEFIIEQSEKAG
ncbi:MAG: alpha/beta fold hydrolase [Candidatus Aenigmarchaeota archaeon]|nr:alpha/beta fold hydrolase [Candidatus Aenigmarchaeota archaeon]